MAIQVLALALVALGYLVIRLLNYTDTPKIRGIPEIPGIPIFGNLYQLGSEHAQVTAKWAERFGAVFQTRLGTKVRNTNRSGVQNPDE